MKLAISSGVNRRFPFLFFLGLMISNSFSQKRINEVLTEKAPKYVILEVRADEDRYSHPIFPHIAQSKEVFFPTLFFNRDIISDLWTHLSYKVVLSQDALYQSSPVLPPQTDPFGHSSLKDTAKLDLLNQHRTKHLHPKPGPEGITRNFYMSSPRSYLQKIKRLCDRKGITLFFLYIPSYGEFEHIPKEKETYQSLGKIIIPPAELLDDPSIWFDEHHLNQSGAQIFSNWLAKELKDNYLKENQD